MPSSNFRIIKQSPIVALNKGRTANHLILQLLAVVKVAISVGVGHILERLSEGAVVGGLHKSCHLSSSCRLAIHRTGAA
jgi:hypothetical protein